MAGLIMPWAAGMLRGGNRYKITLGNNATASSHNSDTWDFGTIALNRTAKAGDLLLLVGGASGDGDDDTFDFSVSGWTNLADASRGYNGVTGEGCFILSKTAAGGETSVSGSLSVSSYAGTMQDYRIRALSVDAACSVGQAVNDGYSGTISLTTTPGDFAILAAIRRSSTSTITGGAATSIQSLFGAGNIWLDEAPTDGSYTLNDTDFANCGVSFTVD